MVWWATRMHGSFSNGEQDGRARPSPSAAPEPGLDLARARRLFAGLVAVYVTVLLLLYALGLFGFLWKTVIVPSLFIVAYLAGRFRGFVRDWAVFLGAIVLFDSCRGLIYGLLLELKLPVHMGYAIELERALFGEPLPTVRLQAALFADGRIGWLERALVVVHASHFLMFLGFGLLVWLVRSESFARFKLAMLIVMYGGIAVYLLVPTVPPWMAANRFHVLPPLAQMTRQIYNLSVPSLAESFDINPVAAMPSLHAAFPALLTLVAFHHFGRYGAIMLAYFGAVVFGIVYMGEHYVVDVLAGALLAAMAYAVAYRVRVLPARVASIPPAFAGAGARVLLRPIALSALLLLLAQGAGFGARAMQGREVPTEDFIARELDGKSPMANYYRALNAYYASDYRRAQPLFAAAGVEVPNAAKQARAIALLGESAYHNRDFATVVATLAKQPKLSPEQALMVAEARLQLGQREQGFQVLDFVAHNLPDDPVVQQKKLALERAYKRDGR